MSQSLINLCPFHRSLEVQGNPKKSEENRAEFTCPPILTFLPMTGPVNVNEKKVVEDKVFRNGCICKELYTTGLRSPVDNGEKFSLLLFDHGVLSIINHPG